jgi:MoxR-like ATPase
MTPVELGQAVQTQLRQVIRGQDRAIAHMLAGLLARGHLLIEGVPGLAKTLLAKCLAYIVGGTFKRVQFTPDLMPSDITGLNVFHTQTATFTLRPGPVFTNLLLADEINRTPPKTQAALLQAMEERMVSIDGTDHALPALFFVMATQNPIEHEGTYPLPEAQLDRFLMKVVLDYPPQEQEIEVLRLHHQGLDPHQLSSTGLKPVATPEDVLSCMSLVQQVTVEEAILHYITEIVRRTREAPRVILGASPRAGVALLTCGKAVAALRGRAFLSPDDVKSVAHAVLRHRLILRPEAELEGITPDRLIDSVLAAVPVPR